MSGEKRIDESNLKSYDFIVPSKQVLTAEKVKVWEESEAYQEYLGFISPLEIVSKLEQPARTLK